MQDESSAAAIRAAGRRLTPQRVLVMDAIRELDGHVTVEQIATRVHAAYPEIDQATVYRTVGLLSRLHLINEVSVGGVSHYEYADAETRHHHMVCEHCGTTSHLEPRYLDRLRETLLEATGFELHTEHFTVSGLCRACRENAAHSHNGHTHAQAQGHQH
jgi:Fur family ferric uptake transcriptional regulator